MQRLPRTCSRESGKGSGAAAGPGRGGRREVCACRQSPLRRLQPDPAGDPGAWVIAQSLPTHSRGAGPVFSCSLRSTAGDTCGLLGPSSSLPAAGRGSGEVRGQSVQKSCLWLQMDPVGSGRALTPGQVLPATSQCPLQLLTCRPEQTGSAGVDPASAPLPSPILATLW